MATQAPSEDPVFLSRLRKHFSAEPAAFPVVGEQFEASDHPNVQKALELYLSERNCSTELYGRGLTLQLEQREQLIAKTDGASAAFVRELLRKAALFATDETPDEPIVADRHVEEALHELVVAGGELTKSLLGVRAPPAR